MKPRKRAKWLALFAVPCAIALAMWPVALRNRQRAKAQQARAATIALTAAVSASLRDFSSLNPAVVRQLIARGADVNLRSHYNGFQSTLLHCVVSGDAMNSQSQRTLVPFLLAHGANINARETDGTTPLMAAVENTRPEVVQLLLRHHARVNLRRQEQFYAVVAQVTALTIAKYTLNRMKGMQQAKLEEQKFDEARGFAQYVRDASLVIHMLKAAGARE